MSCAEVHTPCGVQRSAPLPTAACVDGEAEVLGMEGGRRMHIGETMIFPFREGWRSTKAALARRFSGGRAVPAQLEPAE